MGLADMLVPQDQVRAEALKLAAEIAESPARPRLDPRDAAQRLADRVKAQTEHELQERPGCAPRRISWKA